MIGPSVVILPVSCNWWHFCYCDSLDFSSTKSKPWDHQRRHYDFTSINTAHAFTIQTNVPISIPTVRPRFQRTSFFWRLILFVRFDCIMNFRIISLKMVCQKGSDMMEFILICASAIYALFIKHPYGNIAFS